jgi:hypothetical protein
MPHQLATFLVGGSALDEITELAYYLMQGCDLFICNAGLSDLDQFKDRARVDDGKEPAGIARLAVRFEGFQAGLFEDGKGVHADLLPCSFAELDLNCGTEARKRKRP